MLDNFWEGYKRNRFDKKENISLYNNDFVFHAKMSLTKCSWILILRKNILHPLFLIYLKELTDLNEEKLNDE